MQLYLNDVIMHLKLAEVSARARLTYLEDRPKGLVMRHNHIKHTLALLALIIELKTIAEHDITQWWEESDQYPF